MLFSAPIVLGLALGACASRHPGPKQQKYGSMAAMPVARRSAGSTAVVKRDVPISPKIFILSLVQMFYSCCPLHS